MHEPQHTFDSMMRCTTPILRRDRGWWAPVMLAAACACAGCDDSSPDPTVVVGSSADPLSHGAIDEGTTVWITYGLQGGYHIWGSLRATALDPRDVRMQFALHADGEQIGGADYRDELFRADDGAFEYGGVTVFIYDDVAVEALDGRALEMTLRVTDTGTKSAEDRLSVVARCCE